MHIGIQSTVFFKGDTDSMSDQLTEQAKKIREAMPYNEARASTELNGIGNGIMLGSIPFVALETYKNIAHYDTPEKKLPKLAYIGSAVATVAGAVIGYINGKSEADNLNEYRLVSLKEISDQRKEMDVMQQDMRQLEQDVTKWQARISTPQQAIGLDHHR